MTPSLATQLEQLSHADLIRLRTLQPELEYMFKHALTQQSAYESMLNAARRETHQTIAETYERLYPDRLDELAALLARHYAEARDDVKTAEYALRAGDIALRVNATAEARLHYAQALDALARLPETDQNRRRKMDTLINQVWVSGFADAPALNLARLDQAEALAGRLPESDSVPQWRLAEIYHLKGFIYQQQNNPRESLRYYNEARALAHARSDDQVLAMSTFGIALQLYFQGRFSAAEPLIRDSIDAMRRAGMPLERISPFPILGRTQAAQGLYAEGLAEAERGLTLAQQAHNPSAIEIGYATLAEIYLLGRDLPRMLEAGLACLRAAEAIHDVVFVSGGYCYIALAQSYLGRHEAALENIERARNARRQFKGPFPRQEWTAAAESELALNMLQFGQAQTLAEEAVGFARAVDGLDSEAVAQRVWGRALAAQARPAEAEAHLLESLRLFEAGGARLEAAHTRVALGRLYAARGDSAAARPAFERAAAQFAASGLGDALAHARELMAKLG